MEQTHLVDITARAPGKVILFGEHAVVHGSAAVAAAVGLFTFARVRVLQNDSDGAICLELPEYTLSWSLSSIKSAFGMGLIETDPRFVRSCSEALLVALSDLVKEQLPGNAQTGMALGVVALLFLYLSIIGFQPAKVTVTSDIPMGSGLGSSASFCVSLSGVMLATASQLHFQQSLVNPHDWNKVNEEGLDLINKWAFEGEKIIHGRPSGIDNTVSTFGTIVKFKLGCLTLLEPKLPLRILLTNTKVGRNTKSLVASVSELLGKHPRAMKSIFEAVDVLSEEAVTILQSVSEDHSMQNHKTGFHQDQDGCLGHQDKRKEELILEEIIAMNQGLLQSMGVSHASIDIICSTALKYNLQSKLTGAGGGGCVITLLPQNVTSDVVEKLTAELSSMNFDCFQVDLGCQGVHVKNNI